MDSALEVLSWCSKVAVKRRCFSVSEEEMEEDGGLMGEGGGLDFVLELAQQEDLLPGMKLKAFQIGSWKTCRVPIT